MTSESASLVCPACGSPPVPAPGGAILGGPPTAGDMESTARPWAERAARPRRHAGPFRCASCRETLYRMGTSVLRHRGAAPVLTMAAAADRLRNHLRRLAIVRLGRIEGDCYLLPFLRFEGRTPEGDETFTLLGVSIGEERLERAFLLPADVRPFEPPAEGAAGASGTGSAALRVLWPSLGETELKVRAEAARWSVARTVEWIHYPFWLMRVEDRGRIEGAWIDGIEGKIIHHRMRLAPPVPSTRRIAAWTAAPAAAGGIAALAGAAPVWAGVLSWLAGAALFRSWPLRGWRG